MIKRTLALFLILTGLAQAVVNERATFVTLDQFWHTYIISENVGRDEDATENDLKLHRRLAALALYLERDTHRESALQSALVASDPGVVQQIKMLQDRRLLAGGEYFLALGYSYRGQGDPVRKCNRAIQALDIYAAYALDSAEISSDATPAEKLRWATIQSFVTPTINHIGAEKNLVCSLKTAATAADTLAYLKTKVEDAAWDKIEKEVEHFVGRVTGPTPVGISVLDQFLQVLDGLRMLDTSLETLLKAERDVADIQSNFDLAKNDRFSLRPSMTRLEDIDTSQILQSGIERNQQKIFAVQEKLDRMRELACRPFATLAREAANIALAADIVKTAWAAHQACVTALSARPEIGLCLDALAHALGESTSTASDARAQAATEFGRQIQILSSAVAARAF